MDKQFLTIKDCMKRHGKSYDTIATLFKKKGSPAVRVGHEWQVDINNWDQYLLKLAEDDKG